MNRFSYYTIFFVPVIKIIKQLFTIEKEIFAQSMWYIAIHNVNGFLTLFNCRFTIGACCNSRERWFPGKPRVAFNYTFSFKYHLIYIIFCMYFYRYFKEFLSTLNCLFLRG